MSIYSISQTQSNLIGIPYEYGKASLDGCDCWGLVSLKIPEIMARIDTEYYYAKYPRHEKVGLRTALRIANEAGVRKVGVLRDNTILIGVGSLIACGIWNAECGAILTTSIGRKSHLISWSDWHIHFNKIILLEAGHD